MSVAIKSCCANLYELPITQLLLGPSFHPGGPALTRKLAGAAVVGRATRVLDVASGTGESARVLASHFGCDVVGVDYSAVNITRSRQLSDEAGLSARCSFVEGDAEALPFEASSFDIVICECALCTFPDMAAALGEMKRVLKPRGRVAISDIVLQAPVPAALDNLMGHVLCISGARSREGYLAEMAAAGLCHIRHRDVSQVLEDMVDAVERRIAGVSRLNGALPAELDDAEPTLAAARDFIRAGGGAYAMFTARTPA